jgi:hypothetical protein
MDGCKGQSYIQPASEAADCVSMDELEKRYEKPVSSRTALS